MLLIYGLRLEFVSRWFLVLFGIVNFLFLASEKVALRLTLALGALARLQFPHGVDRRDRAQGRPVRGLPGSASALGLPRDRLPRRRQRGRDPFASTAGLASGTITDMETVLGREVIDEVIFVIEKGKLGEYEEALLVAERHGVPRARLARHLSARAGAAGPRGARRHPPALLHDDAVEPVRARGQAGDRPGPVARALPRDPADPARGRARDSPDLRHARSSSGRSAAA